MRGRLLFLFGIGLIFGLAFAACSFPALVTDTGTAEEAEPVGPAVPAQVPVSVPPANTDGAETILIPGGTFWMGSQEDDLEAEADERPAHQVTLAGYRIYTHEVTNGMYARCVEAGACLEVEALAGGPTAHYADPAFAEHPVSGVDWLMARDYCTWAGGRLPTEAEWELASRSIDSFLFPWGEEEPTCERVNMVGCNAPPDTLAVGSLALGNSAYDVWDLSGNVWEWVYDWYDEDTYFFSPVINPLGPNYSETKVVRGGGLYSEPVMMRSAARQPVDPNRVYDDVGFRCVAMGPLELPAGYVPVEEVHERVPPSLEGGGDRVLEYDPDPEVWVEMGRIGFTCPSVGDMLVTLDYTASGPATLTVSVDGVRWPCGVDPFSGLPTCEHATPAGYGGTGTALVEWCVEVDGFTSCGARTVPLPDPDDCEPRDGPPVFSFSATCPERGLVIGYLEYEPPVDWTLVQLDGADIPWWRISPTQIGVHLRERPWDHPYQLHLEGMDAEGDRHGWWPLVYLPTDCPAEGSSVAVHPVCYEGRPTARVLYWPTARTLASVTADGAPLRCMPTAPGEQMCGDLVGDPGSSTLVTTCIEGESRCLDWPITVPACGAGETGFMYYLHESCHPVFDGPSVGIIYFPTDQPLVSAEAGGTPLTCLAHPDPGTYLCGVVPGAAGSMAEITFCLADGSCYSQSITLGDCAGEEEEPTGEDWSLAGLGCHEGREGWIFFMVDTGLDWLVPGADFLYHVSDYAEDYECSIHPSVAGRLYCAGPRPDSPLELQVCVQQEGAALPTCVHFPDWPAEEATIPDCEAPPPERPACSSYTDTPACVAAGCYWYKGVLGYADGCYPTPPP